MPGANTELQCMFACVTPQDDYLVELCRLGAGELHVVAAFMGGMAAQVGARLCARLCTCTRACTHTRTQTRMMKGGEMAQRD